MKGQIVRLIRDRGFGFIRSEDGQDVFFHRSELQDANFDSLRGDEQVEYEMGTDARSGRQRAVNLRVSQ
jgi:cold shock protein